MGASTTVEIILYYLTDDGQDSQRISTTVEIILYYLTLSLLVREPLSTTVEIILYYLTRIYTKIVPDIYNSRNYSILLNSKFVYLHNFLEPSNFIFIILYNICTIYVK